MSPLGLLWSKYCLWHSVKCQNCRGSGRASSARLHFSALFIPHLSRTAERNPLPPSALPSSPCPFPPAFFCLSFPPNLPGALSLNPPLWEPPISSSVHHGAAIFCTSIIRGILSKLPCVDDYEPDSISVALITKRMETPLEYLGAVLMPEEPGASFFLPASPPLPLSPGIVFSAQSGRNKFPFLGDEALLKISFPIEEAAAWPDCWPKEGRVRELNFQLCFLICKTMG